MKVDSTFIGCALAAPGATNRRADAGARPRHTAGMSMNMQLTDLALILSAVVPIVIVFVLSVIVARRTFSMRNAMRQRKRAAAEKAKRT
jgi:hypothetical protein